MEIVKNVFVGMIITLCLVCTFLFRNSAILLTISEIAALFLLLIFVIPLGLKEIRDNGSKRGYVYSFGGLLGVAIIFFSGLTST